MKKPTEAIHVRIVEVSGMRITVSSTNPGDFEQIGEPPITIGGIDLIGTGKPAGLRRDSGWGEAPRLIFTARHGQNLSCLQFNKRYKLTFY